LEEALPSIAYDASRVALLQPAARPTLFGAGSGPSLSVDAICAECARLAYLRFESDPSERMRLASDLQRVGAVALEIFNADRDSQAFAAVIPAAGPVVVFRGTEPDKATDIGTDLEANTTAWHKGGRVHAGFASAFAALRTQIQPWLDRNGSTAPIFTGHSLGGALATLAASEWPGSRLTTIGSPRVGDADFARTIQAPVRRYVNCCDIVTRVPPDTDWYTHVGERLYFDRNGVPLTAASDAAVSADRSAARDAYLLHDAWVTGNNLLRDLADHAPINYLRGLIA
jgi:hypothetical protein